jgi:hypothetical protein
MLTLHTNLDDYLLPDAETIRQFFMDDEKDMAEPLHDYLEDEQTWEEQVLNAA